MNNDLISREALKKFAIPCNIHNGALTELCVPLYQIDNAPTINTTCPNCDSGYAQGYSDGYLKGKEDRRHGKWIDHWSEDLQKQGYRQCSKCKAGCQIYEHGTRKSELPWIDGQQYTLERICKYCPNCGAKMDGGEES